jgi:hypothetical protein
LEQRASESKELAHLDNEFYEMKEMVGMVRELSWLGEEGPSRERRMKVYERMEEQAMKVLKTCKRLRGKEE